MSFICLYVLCGSTMLEDFRLNDVPVMEYFHTGMGKRRFTHVGWVVTGRMKKGRCTILEWNLWMFLNYRYLSCSQLVSRLSETHHKLRISAKDIERFKKKILNTMKEQGVQVDEEVHVGFTVDDQWEPKNYRQSPTWQLSMYFLGATTQGCHFFKC